MSNDTQFVDGLMVKAPRDGAPDFVKAGIWIKRLELIAWLQAQTEDSINVDVKESKGGKWYAAVNTYKPKEEGQRTGGGNARGGDPSDAIPFAPVRGIA